MGDFGGFFGVPKGEKHAKNQHCKFLISPQSEQQKKLQNLECVIRKKNLRYAIKKNLLRYHLTVVVNKKSPPQILGEGFDLW